MVNLFIVQYFNQDAQAGEAWGGRIRHITNAIERNGSQTQKDIARVEMEVARVVAEMKNNQAKMEEDVTDVKKDIAEILKMMKNSNDKE